MTLLLYTRLLGKLDDVVYKHYMYTLPAAIQKSITRFHFWQDVQRSLFGKLLLAEGLKHIGLLHINLESLKYSEYERPYLDGLDFNISHSGEFVICALSIENKVGIDVEEVKDIPVSDFQDQFSTGEISEILKDKSLRYFYTLWTQKEAFLKAIGKGLNVPLNQVSIIKNKIYREEKPWFLSEINLGIHYVSHLCTDIAEPDIVLKEMTF